MGQLKRDACEHFKLVFWVLLVLYLFLASLALVFGRQAGFATMAWICLGFGILITVIFGGLFVINLLCVWIIDGLRRFRRSKVVP